MEKVTIIIPTYNREKTIVAAIQSVCAQTYPGWEIIVVDDGSTDRTQEVVENIDDTRITYIKNKKNGGPAYSRNVGVEAAQTKYIAFQDSDTFWHPEKLEKQVQQIRDSEYGMVYHSYSLQKKVYPLPEIPMREKQGNVYPYLLYSPMIGTPCMLMEREVFQRVGGFANELRCLEDWELSLRIARENEIGFLDEVLLESGDSDISVSKNAEAELDALFYIMQTYYEDLEKYPLAKKMHFNRISQLAKRNDMMPLYYEKLEHYLIKTGQTVDDMMKLYQ